MNYNSLKKVSAGLAVIGLTTLASLGIYGCSPTKSEMVYTVTETAINKELNNGNIEGALAKIDEAKKSGYIQGKELKELNQLEAEVFSVYWSQNDTR